MYSSNSRREQKVVYGHFNIDHGTVESNIRPTQLAAKNWMHVGHPQAGRCPAVIYSGGRVGRGTWNR